jgi:cobalt-zinc-cadmium efflux system outer membrane protein
MRKIKSCVAFVGIAVLILSPVGVLAEEMPSQDLSLREAIEIAVKTRAELLAANQNTQSSVQLRRQAGFIPSPRFFYQSENLRPGMTFTQDVDTYAYGTEVIEISGKRAARIATAENGITYSKLALEQQRLAIEFSVAQDYWEALRLQYRQVLSEQSVGYYRDILDYHMKRFKEGKIADVDLLRVRLEEARAEASMEANGLAEAEAKQRLARDMGLSQAAKWHLSEAFDVLNVPNEPGASQAEMIEVKLARQSVEAARANLMVQKAQGRPDIDALFGYKRQAGLESTSFNSMLAGFQMNIPIFDRNQGSVAAAQLQIQASNSILTSVQQRKAADLALARMSYDTWRRQVTERYQPILSQAVDIADISRAAYREGGIDLLRLLDAEKLRVDVQNSWMETLGNYHQSVLSLEYAEGVEP